MAQACTLEPVTAWNMNQCFFLNCFLELWQYLNAILCSAFECVKYTFKDVEVLAFLDPGPPLIWAYCNLAEKQQTECRQLLIYPKHWATWRRRHLCGGEFRIVDHNTCIFFLIEHWLQSWWRSHHKASDGDCSIRAIHSPTRTNNKIYHFQRPSLTGVIILNVVGIVSGNLQKNWYQTIPMACALLM